jgi:hypothetical protein
VFRGKRRDLPPISTDSLPQHITHKVIRMIKPLLHPDLNLTLFPPFCSIDQCLRLELSLFQEIVGGPHIHEDMEGALGRLALGEKEGRVVSCPFGGRARTGARLKVGVESLDAPGRL